MKEKMMREITEEMIVERIQATKIFIGIIAFTFYILPAFITDVGSAYIIVFMLTPAICFILGMIYGLYEKHIGFYVTMLFLIYLPSLIIFYNLTLILIGLGYMLLSLMGWYIGESIPLFTNFLVRKLLKK
ncbi:MAG: hypothetical protein ACK5LC_07165 [Coprobacillaceae bacterium]